jgi:DNA end-binding protein Ku
MASVWKGHLAFGLLSIPVKVQVAARKDTGLSFNMLHSACHGRVKQQLVCPSCDGKAIERSDTLKGYEYEKDQYLVVSAQELESAETEASKVMEIDTMVDAAEIDPLLFEESFYIEPDLGGHKGYKLLLEALVAEGKYAVSRIVKNSREHIAIIRPYRGVLMFHTMFYETEVRQTPDAKIDRIELKAEEVSLARQLVQINAGEFDHASYRDRYRTVVEELLATKQAGGVPVIPAAKPKAKEPIDIMAALAASLAAKKGAAPASAPVAAEPAKKARKPKVA